jgi:hypothetical protein
MCKFDNAQMCKFLMCKLLMTMAFFVLNSDITIGGFRFSGVHEVRVRRNVGTLIDTAVIKLPSLCRIAQGKRKSGVVQTTGTLFKDGDAVTINLSYSTGASQAAITASGPTPIVAGNNTGPVTEFQGFVKRRNLNMPLEVECEGYSYALRQTKLTVDYSNSSIGVGDLLNKICAGTGITVQCAVNYPIKGFSLSNLDGVKVCDFIKECSVHSLSIFFINPTTLWCGLPYTALAGGSTIFELPQVSYRLGYNVVKDNGLRERIPSEPVQVILNGKLATGRKVWTASKYKAAKRQERSIANHVPDNATLSSFAQEKEYHSNYIGYEGNINAFLQPFCWPGYMANVVDDRYPERNGVYVIEGTDVVFGLRGARRAVMLGPQLNFGQNYL